MEAVRVTDRRSLPSGSDRAAGVKRQHCVLVSTALLPKKPPHSSCFRASRQGKLLETWDGKPGKFYF